MRCKLRVQDLWQNALREFQKLFPEDVYQTWFANLDCVEANKEALVLRVPSEFAAIWIEDNYLDLIKEQVTLAAGHELHVSLKVRESSRTQLLPASPELHGQERNGVNGRGGSQTTTRRNNDSKDGGLCLNPKNTFENFVVGDGNQLAHAACVAIANKPGRAYNPLFLYGDTGLGKTHLMHAVAHSILHNNPKARVAYVSSEKFTNEFIHAIQENSLIQFRRRYRNVDVLLIDDIHFLSGKERIQEEFFHTFNELFESGRQLFLTSDRPAGEIARLENRLVSRFQWGLASDIQPPDFETRLAILCKKAASLKEELPREILELLAERVARNVRRMEGALIRVVSYSRLRNKVLDVPTVEDLLRDVFLEEAQNRITIEKIQQKVSDYYRIRLSELVSKRRQANIVFPRQVAMYLSRVLTSHALQEIGDAFGGRDHGTVIHACKTVENTMEQERSTKRSVDYLVQQLAHSKA